MSLGQTVVLVDEEELELVQQKQEAEQLPSRYNESSEICT